MSDPSVEQEAAELADLANKGVGKRYSYYLKKSGPGWLQGAITLGGGSLAGALYLGVVMGYHMMWLQPFAMILGVIMLSAISYVALSIKERPFRAMKNGVSPALAWGWLIAAMLANVVWALPQFALGTAALQKNLFPGLFVGDMGKAMAAGLLLLIGIVVVWFYNSGSKGIQIFEFILKILVGVIVLCFFGVVVVMSIKGGLPWGTIAKGFIPDLSLLKNPAPELQTAIAATDNPEFWTEKVSNTQRDKIIAAFATAVGINMTFLLPYSLIKKKWGKSHRELAIFDLSIGLVIPFVLATACVVIASASQFHGKHVDVFKQLESGGGKSAGEYAKNLDARIGKDDSKKVRLAALQKNAGSKDATVADPAKQALGELRAAMPEADRKIAAMIAARGQLRLADTLTPLTGETIAQKVFGIGVVGMAISTIIILMLINGFAVCEMFGAEPSGNLHRFGSMIPGFVGVSGPFVWAGAAAALAVPTSVLGGAMLPIAYFGFLLLMNSKTVLGDNRPEGTKRLIWNVLMVFATIVATLSSVWGMWNKAYNDIPMGKIGVGILAILFVLGVIGYIKNESNKGNKSLKVD